MGGIDDVMDKLADVLEKLVEVEAKIDAPKSVQSICHHCGGDGLKTVGGGENISCPDCGGTGVLMMARVTLREDELK